MATLISDIDKRRGRGRPPTDAKPVLVRLQPHDLAALDAFIDTSEGATRPAAIRAILADWLAVHGFMKRGGDHPEPAGPATDAVRAMDAAIGEHKKTRKPSAKRANRS